MTRYGRLVPGSPRPRCGRAATAAVFALAIASITAACGLRGSSGEPSYEDIDESREEIRQLWREIREWRVSGGMDADPQTHAMRATDRHTVDALRSCPARPETDRCRDVCDLKDAICDNAERICRIARRIGNDPWSEERCSRAKASCREARERCCECIAEEASSAP